MLWIIPIYEPKRMNLQSAYFALYIVVPTLGIGLNWYVLWRLLRIARRSAIRFETTSGLPLAAMSAGDSVTLLTQLVQALFHSVPKTGLPTWLLSGTCKVDIYLMHTTSAFSVWCWFALSILRYTAVFHPIKYRTIWRQPRNALKLLACLCFLFESWILFFVVYSEDGRICAEHPNISPHNVKAAHLMDIALFYAIPSLLRIFFDGIVLFQCYSPFSMMDVPLYERRYAISVPTHTRRCSFNPEFESSVDVRQNMTLVMSISAATTEHFTKKRQLYVKKKTAMVMRSIIISVLNLVLNLPSHILRTWLTLDDNGIDHKTLEILEPISQILYFSQFICNAFYLSTSIYETNGTPRSTVVVSSGRHISRCVSNDDES
ncbi:hypothetical protein Y032_0096g2956 [Ancylostoma ceylanicum]|uniref:G-protein coupled receptors family 1 profile domain-containing protein n=1 Tax=Ancylostoma ceylanicum TaxID=53326 RepID=A0A016TK97_9BILA|nr:hypothetical protein Y032_0096g2956 [Ancylostoma ceylanicum]